MTGRTISIRRNERGGLPPPDIGGADAPPSLLPREQRARPAQGILQTTGRLAAGFPPWRDSLPGPDCEAVIPQRPRNFRLRRLQRVALMAEIGPLQPLRQIALRGRRFQRDLTLDQRIDAVG